MKKVLIILSAILIMACIGKKEKETSKITIAEGGAVLLSSNLYHFNQNIENRVASQFKESIKAFDAFSKMPKAPNVLK
ncbi:MAG: hypothetical protein AAF489_01360 [Bacteroidota bacterium]